MESEKRILIVDDLPLNVQILCKILGKHYALDTAGGGEECLAKVASFHPQLVLLDIMMPGMDGYEVCRRIKQGASDPFIQVILVSGKGSVAERLRGYEAMADDYVVKPFDHSELFSKVRVQFRLWEVQHELRAAKESLEQYANHLEGLVEARTRDVVATQDILVFSLAQLAESRDAQTGEHLQRMRDYALILGRELAVRGPYVDQIDASFLANLYRAAPLHDVGKVGIHDAVLLKPGRLSAEEMEHIKQHVVVGARTLESARDLSGGAFLTMAAEIARYHHEWFDGRGYCAGLRGEAIPLSARIVALADCYDAITSRRHYKPPLAPPAAREIILDESGTHFDPVVVDAFLACFDAFVTSGAVAAEDPAQSLLAEANA